MLHYTALITLQLQQQLLPQLQQQYQLHHITLHCTHCTAVHYNYVQIQMQLQLHYITQHYSTLLTLITLHYATTTTTTAAATTSVTTTTLHYTMLH